MLDIQPKPPKSKNPGNGRSSRWLPAKHPVKSASAGKIPQYRDGRGSCGDWTDDPPRQLIGGFTNDDQKGHHHHHRHHQRKPTRPQSARQHREKATQAPSEKAGSVKRPSSAKARPSTPQQKLDEGQLLVHGRAYHAAQAKNAAKEPSDKPKTSEKSDKPKTPEGYEKIPMPQKPTPPQASKQGSEGSQKPTPPQGSKQGSEGSKRKRPQSARTHRDKIPKDQIPPEYAAAPAGQNLHISQDVPFSAILCMAEKKQNRFEGITSYMDDYIKYPVTPRRELLKPPSKRQDPPRFEGQTQYQADYTKKQLPRQQPFHQSLNLEVKHYAPFCGDTTYATHFKTYPTPPRPKRREDKAAAVRGADDRDFNTAYRADYYEKPLPQGWSVLELQPRGSSHGQSHAKWDPKKSEWIEKA